MQFFAVGQEAVGVIAIGQFATGVFAFGQVATGVVAVGQIARGVVAVGQVGVGIYSVGMLGIGIHSTLGMLAIGGRARGMLGLSVFPSFTSPKFALPQCERLDLLLHSRREGWVEAAVHAYGNGLALFSAGAPLPLRIDSRIHAQLRLAQAAARNDEVCVHVGQCYGEPIVDEVTFAPLTPSVANHPVVVVVRLTLAAALGVAYWLAVLQPLGQALMAG